MRTLWRLSGMLHRVELALKIALHAPSFLLWLTSRALSWRPDPSVHVDVFNFYVRKINDAEDTLRRFLGVQSDFSLKCEQSERVKIYSNPPTKPFDAVYARRARKHAGPSYAFARSGVECVMPEDKVEFLHSASNIIELLIRNVFCVVLLELSGAAFLFVAVLIYLAGASSCTVFPHLLPGLSAAAKSMGIINLTAELKDPHLALGVLCAFVVVCRVFHNWEKYVASRDRCPDPSGQPNDDVLNQVGSVGDISKTPQLDSGDSPEEAVGDEDELDGLSSARGARPSVDPMRLLFRGVGRTVALLAIVDWVIWGSFPLTTAFALQVVAAATAVCIALYSFVMAVPLTKTRHDYWFSSWVLEFFGHSEAVEQMKELGAFASDKSAAPLQRWWTATKDSCLAMYAVWRFETDDR